MVTHNPALTAYATRVINMLDGQIDTDIKTVADSNLPQPISVKIKKKKKKAEEPEFVAITTDQQNTEIINEKPDEKSDEKSDKKPRKRKKSRRKK